ncbi:hypothetical protein Moror_4426 [Moniliophthora roreri MCA 2997]|uniref:Uncharacterized protein n=1 Tax=Moniliophthora roreri (strain MCA 2997) TaxID=1381753 RepID=V2XJ62_MONRO|nr:hypothetical protein Moror_4426 [Moniliophthora roreri MCA 2997]KAI3607585.1 hypothetical protein WG66_005023 [Moniliophthora roreri]
MLRSNSDTTTTTSSPTPVSPFSSNYSVPSEATSDEVPDLGQFTAVLRAWNHFQPLPRTVSTVLAARQDQTSSSSRTRSFPASSAIDSDSDQRPANSTVWNQRPIASYLSSLVDTTTTDTETDRERENLRSHVFSSISPDGFHHGDYDVAATTTDDDPDADIDGDERRSDTEGEQSRTVQIEDMDELDSTFGHDIYDDDNDSNIKEQQRVEPDSSDLDQRQVKNIGPSLTNLGDVSLEDIEEQPSLGLLDEALRFIAAERERWNAQREAGLANGATSLSSGIEPRRKRRRKRRTPRAHSTTRTSTSTTAYSLADTSSSSTPFPASQSTPSLLTTIFQSTADRDDGDDADADDSSSSFDQHYSSGSRQDNSRQPMFKSTPGTPARRPSRRGVSKPTSKHSHVQANAKLKHARSTPQLRVTSQDIVIDETEEDNPRVKQLRSLGKKLEKLFPEDRAFLRGVGYGLLGPPQTTGGRSLGSYFDRHAGDELGSEGVLGSFVDTRGIRPKVLKDGDGDEAERLIHVFVDHSNILIGLLNYLKRHPRQHPQYHDVSQSSPGADNSTGGFTSPSYPKPPKHLSHSALTLILERGRPVTRRVLVTSSPLYQPMDSAEQLGFEVRVFARVPDLGDGMDRQRDNGGDRQRHVPPFHGHKRSVSSGSFTTINNVHNSGSGSGGGAELSSSPKKGRRRAGSVNTGTGGNSGPPASGNNRKKGHHRGPSGGTSTESEQGGNGNGNGGFPQAFMRSLGGATPMNIPLNGNSPTTMLSSSVPNSNVSTPPVATPGQAARIRYREQGVDELLQLKLHQALASIDGPPPKDSTIILATGDGNTGQFNEDGFLGSVRTALKRGWKVELYAWEGGLSRAWKREFGESSEWGSTSSRDGPRFKVIGMEQFGSELVELYF